MVLTYGSKAALLLLFLAYLVDDSTAAAGAYLYLSTGKSQESIQSAWVSSGRLHSLKSTDNMVVH